MPDIRYEFECIYEGGGYCFSSRTVEKESELISGILSANKKQVGRIFYRPKVVGKLLNLVLSEGVRL